MKIKYIFPRSTLLVTIFLYFTSLGEISNLLKNLWLFEKNSAILFKNFVIEKLVIFESNNILLLQLLNNKILVNALYLRTQDYVRVCVHTSFMKPQQVCIRDLIEESARSSLN